MVRLITIVFSLSTLLVNATKITCDPAEIFCLKDSAVQSQLFYKIDSILKVQYPNDDKEKGNFVDINKIWLDKFLNDINKDSLSLNNKFEKKYHFNISPGGTKEQGECYDIIQLKYHPKSCSYTLVIDNSFLIPSNWCTQSTVLYYISFSNGSISSVGRNEAG